MNRTTSFPNKYEIRIWKSRCYKQIQNSNVRNSKQKHHSIFPAFHHSRCERSELSSLYRNFRKKGARLEWQLACPLKLLGHGGGGHGGIGLAAVNSISVMYIDLLKNAA